MLMKKHFRLYMDTSFWGRLTEEHLVADRRATYRFLNRFRFRHDFLSSPLVLEEIWDMPNPTQRRIIERRFQDAGPVILSGRSQADAIAQALTREGAFGVGMLADLIHLGYAIRGYADAVVTWDVSTMAREKVRIAVHAYCHREGRPAPLIGRPEEVAQWLGLS